MAPRSDPKAEKRPDRAVRGPAKGRRRRPVAAATADIRLIPQCRIGGSSPARKRALRVGRKRAGRRSRSGVSQSDRRRRPAAPNSRVTRPLQPGRLRQSPCSKTRTGRPVQDRIASTTERPRGARAPGDMATSTEVISRQSAVRSSRMALDRAGVELAPVRATLFAARAVASSSGKAATKSRASARST